MPPAGWVCLVSFTLSHRNPQAHYSLRQPYGPDTDYSVALQTMRLLSSYRLTGKLSQTGKLAIMDLAPHNGSP